MVQVLSKSPDKVQYEEFNATAAPATDRLTWLYYLTILAGFMVVLTHVSAGVILNTTDPFKWWVSNITDSMSRWCVPVFVMMSGYLLLDPKKNYSLGSFYKKRASKILIPLVFWSLFYIGVVVIKRYLSNQPVTIDNLIIPILKGQPYYHLWYLYMLIGLYLVTPFLRKIVAASRKRELVFLCAVLMLMAMVVNIADYFFYHNNFWNGTLFFTWFLFFLGYFLAGYLIGQVLKMKIKLYIPIIIFCVGTIITAVGCYFLTARYSFDMGQYFYSFLSPTVIIMAFSAFYIAKEMAWLAPKVKFMEKTCLLMLGVYVMHPFFIMVLSHYGINAINYNPIISIPAISASIFIICCLMAAGIIKIPYVRRII